VGAAEAFGGAGEDRLRGADGIVAHVAVPDAKHCPALVRQPLIPDDVALTIGVLPGIDLHDELRPAAGKVGDIKSDRQLPRELRTVAGQQLPHLPFFPCRAGPQRASTLGARYFHTP
jgi:hypothetical protein